MAYVDLDDEEKLRSLDSAHALSETARYADQFRAGLRVAKGASQTVGSFVREVRRTGVGSVLILGTGGGSAFSANLLRTAFFREASVPVVLHQGYHAPGFVGPDTLVIAVSHSGNTEEIVSAYSECVERGAPSLAITSGGALLELAGASGLPAVRIPSGMMPRIAFGHIFVPLLYVLQEAGFIPGMRDLDQGLSGAFEAFEQGARLYGPAVPCAENFAKRLASDLAGYVPVVYGLSEVTEAAADRFKRQLGENAKVMAFSNAIPGLHHDEAVAWDDEPGALRRFFFILLDDPEADGKMRRRVTVTRDLLEGRSAGVTVLEGHGATPLERLFSLVQFGDFVSLYLALRRGIDPTPVPVIDLFKRKMAE